MSNRYSLIWFIAFVASSSFAKPLKPYLGPLGLKWGQSMEDVKKNLNDRFTFNREGKADEDILDLVVYSGEFAGFKDSIIEADFFEGKLMAVVVLITPPNLFTLSKTWEAVVEKMTGEHGKPDKIEKAPDVTHRGLTSKVGKSYPKTKNRQKIMELMGGMQQSLEGEKYTLLDAKILKGEWTPAAAWKFKNDVYSTITVRVEDGASQVGWTFINGPEFKKIERAAEAKKTKDF